MKTHRRIPPADRKAEILAAAVSLSRAHGYARITRDAIAAEAACSTGLIGQYFGTMAKLRRAVMGAALALEIPEIIAQGLAARDPRAMGAPEKLKERAIQYLVGG